MALFTSCRRLIIIPFLLLCGYSPCFAQNASLRTGLLKITIASDSINQTMPMEKLYLQFDKPYYAIGDTIWFKAYLFNSSFFTPSDKSGMLYVDIANDSNKVIKQYRLLAKGGLSHGNIYLNENEFLPGTYTIRAYTNWMRNFSADQFFYETFYVSGSNKNTLLVNTRFNTSVIGDKNVLTAKLLFSETEKSPFAVKPMQVTAMDGNKRLGKQKMLTGVDGTVDVSFNFVTTAPHLSLIAETDQKDKRIRIPVILNRPENTDVQFLPESGGLVAGLPAHIGFKAIGENGLGINISGVIEGNDQKPVAEFRSLHDGMGCVDLPAVPGEIYTAKVTLPDGKIKEYPLPAVKLSGTVLHVDGVADIDSLEISVAATNDIMQSNNSYFLIARAKGIVCYGAIINFKNGRPIKGKIAKNLFPSGITQFTLMAANGQPLNERLVFIDHHDQLDIQPDLNQKVYLPGDSVALQIKVTDHSGQPAAGNFSMSVTDDAQVNPDTAKSENILSRMLLSSDLKGYIEDPGYYLSSNPDATQTLDNLLLTQGWIGYGWKNVFNPTVIRFRPEYELTVGGRVSSAFNKPLKGTNVLLFSRSPTILMDTITNNLGQFVFQHFPQLDTPVFVIKAVNKNGKSFNVGIDVDEVAPPEFQHPAGPELLPWYVNSDTTLLRYTQNIALMKQQQNFIPGTHQLKEVKITATKIVKESHNLNGPGNADVVLDEKDIEKAGKKTFLTLLEENIKGFAELFPVKKPHWYYVHQKGVILLVDGVPLADIYESMAFADFKSYLEAHNAEDIKGIEVMSSPKFAINYVARFFPFADVDAFVFVEITTRAGHGPIIGNTPGMYLYKPLPVSTPAQFYKPRYVVKDDPNHLPDVRATIDWEPDIKTGINGRAKMFFYATGKPTTYTVTIEGTDMKGNLGSKTFKLKVGGK